jgi:hypothetical protein
MTRSEISTIENAGRAAMGWVPDRYDEPSRPSLLMTAIVPAAAILVAAASLLLVFS